MKELIYLESKDRLERLSLSKEASEKNSLIRNLSKEDGFDQALESEKISTSEKLFILFNVDNLKKISKLNYHDFSKKVKENV
jgi:hypothetical protein